MGRRIVDDAGYGSDFPVMQINLIGEQVSERSVLNTAIRLRDEIETLSSVLSADIQGQREEVLEILIDPDALHAYRISSEELIGTLVRNNSYFEVDSFGNKLPYLDTVKFVYLGSESERVTRFEEGQLDFINGIPSEKVKKFVLLHNEWSVENGEITPTLKLKRAFILKKYQEAIEEIYS